MSIHTRPLHRLTIWLSGIAATLLASLVLIGAVAAQGNSPQAALDTGFTYQGQLKTLGSPVNALCSMRFSLWNTEGSGVPPAGGTQVGTTQTLDVTVTGGLFAVVVNSGNEFGSNAFTGEARWLQIAVNDCGTGLSYTKLSPRVRLTAVPYALYSLNNWGLNGNSGLTGSNYLGTKDNVMLTLGVNSTAAMRIIPGFDPGYGFAPNIIGGSSTNAISPTNIAGATIAGGGVGPSPNRVGESYAFVGGGALNAANGYQSVVVGGGGNRAQGTQSFTGGGNLNQANGYQSAVVGGGGNQALGIESFVGGGNLNQANGTQSTIGGGKDNTTGITGTYATIAGGEGNIASGDHSTVGGGGGDSDVYVGTNNTASGNYATVAGGQGNIASGNYSTVSGGGGSGGISNEFPTRNVADGHRATIGGGGANKAHGDSSTVPGGIGNSAYGNGSFAAGSNAHASYDGSFVWGDQSTFDSISSTAPNQFVVRATGGVRITGNGNATSLFIHTVTGGNICPGRLYATYIDNPILNNNPDAILFITPNYGSLSGGMTPPAQAVGVFYDNANGGCGNGHWVIYNLSGTLLANWMLPGQKFNVLALLP